MAKKRQQDFARVQLRPGRLLSKRGNITSTKFRSRKIIMPKEKVMKMKSELTISDYLSKIEKTGKEKDKVGFLIELNRLIRRQSKSLNAYVPQIFGKILEHIRNPSDNIRKNALKVIISVLELTDDLQLLSFADVLCNHISAIMKNPNQKISSVSLTLLNSMLKHHPELICCNFNILFNLLPSERKHYTRKMPIDKETFLYSENEDIDALGHINTFLENLLLLRNKSDSTNEEDKIVNLCDKTSKSVMLFTGGGIKPIDIAKAHAAQFKPQINLFDEVEKLRSIIDTLFKLISFYFYQITGKKSNSDDNLYNKEEISDLSILFQLLCNITELAEISNYTKATEEIATLVKAVFSTHRKRFPFELYSLLPDTSSQSLAILNASLCYLHMKFLSPDDSYDDEDGELIMKYLRKFFIQEKTFSSAVKCQCVPYFLKMIQLCKYKNDVPEVISLLLKHLVLLLKTRVNHANKKVLINFLMDMCLLREYRFWIETIPMALWYEWLVSHLKDVSKLERNIVNVIYKVAKMRHTSFITLLDFNILKPLLTKYDSEYRDLAICLLHHMDIDNEFLKNIYYVLSQDSFPKTFAVTVIRVLNVRFKEYPPSKRPYVDYMQFLFNIAIDVSSFSKNRFIDDDENDYTRTVQCLQGGSPFCVIPSLHWKEHSKLFEVCFLCLRELPIRPLSVMFMTVVKELLESTTLIPVHSALAILKLDIPELKDEYHRLLMLKLNLSCLLTTSVLTHLLQEKPNKEWYKWNVCELMESMALTCESAIQILEILEQGNFGREQPDGLLVYHLLRIIKVFVEKNLLNYNHAYIVKFVLRVMSSLAEEQCSDKTVIDQPLFHQIQNFFITHL